MTKTLNKISLLDVRQKVALSFLIMGVLLFSMLTVIKFASAATITIGTEKVFAKTSATAEPEASSTPIATTEPTPIQSQQIPFEAVSLSTADLHSMQQKANDGMMNFYEWKVGESSAQRQERMKTFFTADSPALVQAPDSQPIAIFEKGQMISKGSIDTISLGKGTETEYQLTLGVVVKGQYNYSGKIDQQSMILERKENILVIMSKADGDWKIKSFSAVK